MPAYQIWAGLFGGLGSMIGFFGSLKKKNWFQVLSYIAGVIGFIVFLIHLRDVQEKTEQKIER